jgi:hypothetical protein
LARLVFKESVPLTIRVVTVRPPVLVKV